MNSTFGLGPTFDARRLRPNSERSAPAHGIDCLFESLEVPMFALFGELNMP
jgi:hypothetical protein